MSQRWEDERYVRLYTRDTIGWKMLPWQSKALFPLLLRKVDRAGILDLGEDGIEGLAVMVELPIEVAEPGLQGLLKRGTLELIEGHRLVMPNFIKAQEAISSDAQRKRDQRERARAAAMETDNVSRTVTDESRNVTISSRSVTSEGALKLGVGGVGAISDIAKDGSTTSEMSRNVTGASRNVTGESRSVTLGHEMSRAVTPCLAVPSLTEREESDPEIVQPLTLIASESSSEPQILGKAKTSAQRKRVHQFADLSQKILGELNSRRREVYPAGRKFAASYENLDAISERLELGATADDCQHVIAVAASEVARGGDPKWFNPETPFRANWQRLSAGSATFEPPRQQQNGSNGTHRPQPRPASEVIAEWQNAK